MDNITPLGTKDSQEAYPPLRVWGTRMPIRHLGRRIDFISPTRGKIALGNIAERELTAEDFGVETSGSPESETEPTE